MTATIAAPASAVNASQITRACLGVGEGKFIGIWGTLRLRRSKCLALHMPAHWRKANCGVHGDSQRSGTGVPPVRIVQPTHGRDARATTASSAAPRLLE